MFDDNGMGAYNNIYRGRTFTIGGEVELGTFAITEKDEENKLIFNKISDIKQKVNKLIEVVSIDYADELNEINVMLGDLEMEIKDRLIK